jgi:Pyruvate/2-oxoacid:ferredoxin oxidoreductase delta subunit/Pyruvate/2-oxoacid:ferredoxin oxidoreductase gamma subunit
MKDRISIKSSLRDFFLEGSISEFPIFCIARQGGRTAVEILARALIMEGKHAYTGQNLTGLRSMGANSMLLRFAETEHIPPGIGITQPAGALFMHEALMVAGKGLSFMSQLTPGEVVERLQTGILMVCTAKAPDELPYPKPFEGTVATVDAEGIFAEKVGIQPAPSGITALGLFAAAAKDVVSLGALKEATLAHERLRRDLRESNVVCLEEAYKRANVVHGLKLPGRPETAMRGAPAVDVSTEHGTLDDPSRLATRSLSAMWRGRLPVCDVSKCECGECLSAYSCPEAAIAWQEDEMSFDYNFCKSCGNCVTECVFGAITMEDAKKALARGAPGEGK